MNRENFIDEKTTTSFRINRELLEKLKMLARRNNRSLNNYVETVLFDVVSQKTSSGSASAADAIKKLDNFDMNSASDGRI